MMESQSPLPVEGGGAVRRRRIGASVAHMIRTYPQGFAQLLPKQGACVTGLAFVSPVLHDGEPELPSASKKQPP